MSQEKKRVEVNVVFLVYDPKRCPETPLLHFCESCTTTAYELQQHRTMKRNQRHLFGADDYKHYKWYNSVLRSELKFAGDCSSLKIQHWNIDTGDEELFLINGELFADVTIITGPDMEHWYCSNLNDENTAVCFQDNNLHGSRFRQKNKQQHFETNDILEKRKRLLRPEPSNDLFEMANIIYKEQIIQKIHKNDCKERLQTNTVLTDNEVTKSNRNHQTGLMEEEGIVGEISGNQLSQKDLILIKGDHIVELSPKLFKLSKYSKDMDEKFEMNTKLLFKAAKIMNRALQYKIVKIKERLMKPISEED